MEGGGGGAEGEGSAFRPRAFVRCDRTGVDCLGSESGALATLWYLEAVEYQIALMANVILFFSICLAVFGGPGPMAHYV